VSSKRDDGGSNDFFFFGDKHQRMSMHPGQQMTRRGRNTTLVVGEPEELMCYVCKIGHSDLLKFNFYIELRLLEYKFFE
jgi:hypothetical protein